MLTNVLYMEITRQSNQELHSSISKCKTKESNDDDDTLKEMRTEKGHLVPAYLRHNGIIAKKKSTNRAHWYPVDDHGGS